MMCEIYVCFVYVLVSTSTCAIHVNQWKIKILYFTMQQNKKHPMWNTLKVSCPYTMEKRFSPIKALLHLNANARRRPT